MTLSSSTLVYELFHNKSLLPQTIVAKNTRTSSTPFTFTTSTIKTNDLNTLKLNGESNNNVPYGLTTKNYHNSSYTNFYTINDASEGVASTNFELINLNGENFNIIVTFNSKTITDTLDLTVYSPNNTILLTQTLTPASPTNFETREFNIKSYKYS